MRIVSLLPSATEIICELGLRERLVGVSHECDYPSDVSELPAVTSSVIPKDASSEEIDRKVREHLRKYKALYLLDLELLRSLRADLIVTQALCDVCAVSAEDVESAVDSLPERPAVVNLEPTRLDEVISVIEQISQASGAGETGARVISSLRDRIERVGERTVTAVTRKPRVVFLEWIDPPFNAGHWTPEIVDLAGGEDCLGTGGRPSRTLEWSEVVEAAPDVIVVACCGYDLDRGLEDLPILENLPGWERLPCVSSGRVYFVDGNAFFNRPGPRLAESLEIVANILHPDIHPLSSALSGSFKCVYQSAGSARADQDVT